MSNYMSSRTHFPVDVSGGSYQHLSPRGCETILILQRSDFFSFPDFHTLYCLPVVSKMSWSQRPFRVPWVGTKSARLLFPVRVMLGEAINGLAPGLSGGRGWGIKPNSFLMKLWSNVPDNEMWNASITVPVCTLQKRSESCSERLPSDALYWLVFCFSFEGHIGSYDNKKLQAWVTSPCSPPDPFLYPVLPVEIPGRTACLVHSEINPFCVWLLPFRLRLTQHFSGIMLLSILQRFRCSCSVTIWTSTVYSSSPDTYHFYDNCWFYWFSSLLASKLY